MNPTVTTNQKPTIDTKKTGNEHKHIPKENHQTTGEGTRRRRKEQRRTTKTTRKQVTK